MSEEEYLAFERRSEDKHEFLDGEVYAMAGASEAHVLLESSLNAARFARLAKCRGYTANMRVGIPGRHAYFYELRGENATLELAAAGASIPLAEIYRPLDDLLTS